MRTAIAVVIGLLSAAQTPAPPPSTYLEVRCEEVK
jgi:hypothetical protein